MSHDLIACTSCNGRAFRCLVDASSGISPLLRFIGSASVRARPMATADAFCTLLQIVTTQISIDLRFALPTPVSVAKNPDSPTRLPKSTALPSRPIRSSDVATRTVDDSYPLLVSAIETVRSFSETIAISAGTPSAARRVASVARSVTSVRLGAAEYPAGWECHSPV